MSPAPGLGPPFLSLAGRHLVEKAPERPAQTLQRQKPEKDEGRCVVTGLARRGPGEEACPYREPDRSRLLHGVQAPEPLAAPERPVG